MALLSHQPRCSFCGKGPAQVGKLVAGPRVFICDSCIEACKAIIDSESAGQQQTAPASTASSAEKPIATL